MSLYFCETYSTLPPPVLYILAILVFLSYKALNEKIIAAFRRIQKAAIEVN